MLRAEEIKATFEMPTLGQNPQKALPIPLTKEEINRKLICDVAEEIHPGCWSLDGPERNVKKLLDSTVRPINNKVCNCNDCSNRNSKDCKFNRNLPLHKRLIIKIPETTIRNDRGDSHHMRDFYIMIGLNDDYSKASSTYLHSMRSTVTTEEYAVGAFHPHSSHRSDHVTLRDYFEWRGMCLGGDTELTDLMYTLFREGINRNALFELLILFHVYAGWESLEGGPFRQMRQYKYPRNSNNPSSPSLLSIEKINTKVLHILASDDDIAKPELVGNDNALAISNTVTSIVPATKSALLSFVSSGIRRTSVTISKSVLQHLGTILINGNFTGLLGTSSRGRTKKSRNWYLSKIEEMHEFNDIHGDDVLKFNGKVNFQMILKEEGLGDEESELITDEQLERSSVDPAIIATVTRSYLEKFKQFKSLEKY